MEADISILHKPGHFYFALTISRRLFSPRERSARAACHSRHAFPARQSLHGVPDVSSGCESFGNVRRTEIGGSVKLIAPGREAVIA
jgi:hypothetical protein